MSDARRFAAWFRDRAADGRAWGFLRHLLNGHAPEPSAESRYVRLAIQLKLERPAGQKGKSVLLTSPGSEQLIQETGQEFARVLAQELGQRVLLVEAGLGRGTEAPGLTDLLAHGPERLSAAVRATGHERVFLLPPGSPELAPLARAGGRHAELIATACASYDCVLLLGSPVLEDPRSLVFAPFVDHALLLAFDARTYVSEVDASLRALAERNASGVGVVLAREGRPTHP